MVFIKQVKMMDFQHKLIEVEIILALSIIEKLRITLYDEYGRIVNFK